MTDLVINIRRKFLFIPYTTRIKRSIPETWGEVPEKKIPKLLRYLLFSSQAPTPFEITKLLVRLPYRIWKHLSADNIDSIREALAWLDISKDSTDILIPEFKFKGIVYKGPKSNLANGSGSEFALADKYYTQYSKTEDPKFLACICACLYRPNMHFADPYDTRMRIVSAAQIEKLALHFEDLPVTYKIYALHFWHNIKLFVEKNYSILFNQDKQGGSFMGEKFIDLGWSGIFMQLGELGVFGNYKEVCNTNIHTILMYLVNREQQHREKEFKAWMKAEANK